jgi:hypothetical protein
LSEDSNINAIAEGVLSHDAKSAIEAEPWVTPMDVVYVTGLLIALLFLYYGWCRLFKSKKDQKKKLSPQKSHREIIKEKISLVRTSDISSREQVTMLASTISVLVREVVSLDLKRSVMEATKEEMSLLLRGRVDSSLGQSFYADALAMLSETDLVQFSNQPIASETIQNWVTKISSWANALSQIEGDEAVPPKQQDYTLVGGRSQ